MRHALSTTRSAMSDHLTMAYIRIRNAAARCTPDERGQVGNIVLIGVLVVLAVVAGILIFNAVSHSAQSTASCVTSPSSCANAAP